MKNDRVYILDRGQDSVIVRGYRNAIANAKSYCEYVHDGIVNVIDDTNTIVKRVAWLETESAVVVW